MEVTQAQIDAAVTKARHVLWRRGELSYLWHGTQLRIAELIEKSQGRQYFLNCSRRLGKTFLLLSMGFARCLKSPGSRVLFLAPTGKAASDIVADIAVKMLPDCPADVLPEYKAQAHEYHFKNGSILRIKGTNSEQASALRGTECHLAILDECAQMDNLKEIVKSVVLPMVLSTNGRIILATTPADSPGHDSFEIYSSLAERGLVSTFTIRDAPHYTDAIKAEFLIETGEDPADAMAIVKGLKEPKTTQAQRELFARWVASADSRVIPEWTPEAALEMVQPVEYDGVSDCYTVLDPAIKDGTGIIYAYYDFRKARIAIIGEDHLRHANTATTAEAVLEKEYRLYQGAKPYMRYSDTDARLILDFNQLHGLNIAPVDKPRFEEGINLIRNVVRNRELVIDPSCVKLIKQLEFAIYNKAGKDFARDAEGHQDVLSALRYLCRMVNRRRMPAGYVPSHRDVTNTNNRGIQKTTMRQEKAPGLLPNTKWGRKLSGKPSTRRK